MTWKPALLVIAAMVGGCRDKQPTKQAEPAGAGSAAPQDPAWVDRLPELASGATQLMLDRATGLVGIAADGTLSVAKPPQQVAGDPRTRASDPVAGGAKTSLEGLVAALGIPPVAKRTPTLFEGEGTGSAAEEQNPIDAQFARLAHPVPSSGAPAPPTRATTAFGLAHDHDVSAGVVVFADANAPAAALVDVLAQTGGFVAVRTGRALGALPLALDRQTPAPGDPTKSWFEVRLGAALELEMVPSKPLAIPAVAQLTEAITAAKANAVDLLVTPTTTVQQVVTAVAALRAAKVESIALGRAPEAGTPEATARGDHGARVIAWNLVLVDAAGADAAPYRAALDATLEPIRACYAKLVAAKPELAGTARVEVAIAQKTGTATATAVDVPPPLAKCIADAVKAARFPGAPAQVGVLAKLAFLPR